MKQPRAARRVRSLWWLALALTITAVGLCVMVVAEPFLTMWVSSSPGSSPARAAPEPRQPTGAERLARQWSEAYNQRDFSRAIELGLRLTELAPDNSAFAYNLACVYSLDAQPDRAAHWLMRAAENGFVLLRLFETDPDLENMRSHAGYRAALAVVKETRAAELAELRAEFERMPLHVVLPPDYQPDQPAPLIVALHGKGSHGPAVADQWRNIAAEMGAILMAPQAVSPLGGGFSWCARDTNDSLCDDAEFLVRLAVASVLGKHKIDHARTILTGFSEGGFVVQLIGPRPPYICAGVIPMGCGYLREFDEPPRAVGDRPPRFFFMAGENDHALSTEEIHAAAHDYNAAGFAAEARLYPEVGHQFPIKRDEELRRAVDFVLRR